MKKYTLILTALVVMFSCEKAEKTCNCNNPIEDLAWLKDLKSSFTNCTCRMSIIQAKYNNKTVFYSTMNDPLCDGYYPIVLLDCNGDAVKVYNPPLNDNFTNEVKEQKELYSCKTEL